MLLLRSEQEMLQELRGREVLTAPHVDILGNIGNHVNHFLLFVELESFLREIAETHRITDVELPTVDGFLAEQHLDERTLARTVVTYDSHLLEACEVVVEVFEDN